MRFKDFLKESIIDIPRKTYARPVFDNADTSNPTLKPSVQKQILDENFLKDFKGRRQET